MMCFSFTCRFRAVLFILIFAAFGNMLFAQTCKYKKNEVDEFTGTSIKVTSRVNMYMGLLGGLVFSCAKYDDRRVLHLKYATSSIFTIEKGGALMFILENGEKVELIATETIISKPYTTQFGTTWSADIKYAVSNSDYDKIIASPFKKMRIYRRQNYDERKMKKKKSVKLQQLFKCIQ